MKAPPSIVALKTAPGFDLRSETDLRALTMNPGGWAYAFWKLGKDCENRGHDRFRFLLGCWFCIHAGVQSGGYEMAWELHKIAGVAVRKSDFDPIHCSIVAVAFFAELARPGERLESRWRFADEWGMMLPVVVPIEPVSVKPKCAQGLWRVPEPARDLVVERFNDARRRAVESR